MYPVRAQYYSCNGRWLLLALKGSQLMPYLNSQETHVKKHYQDHISGTCLHGDTQAGACFFWDSIHSTRSQLSQPKLFLRSCYS